MQSSLSKAIAGYLFLNIIFDSLFFFITDELIDERIGIATFGFITEDLNLRFVVVIVDNRYPLNL